MKALKKWKHLICMNIYMWICERLRGINNIWCYWLYLCNLIQSVKYVRQNDIYASKIVGLPFNDSNRIVSLWDTGLTKIVDEMKKKLKRKKNIQEKVRKTEGYRSPHKCTACSPCASLCFDYLHLSNLSNDPSHLIMWYIDQRSLTFPTRGRASWLKLPEGGACDDSSSASMWSWHALVQFPCLP